MTNDQDNLKKQIKATKTRIRSLQIKLVRLTAELEIRRIETCQYSENYIHRRKKK